ncbi:MAG: V/A-type H+/Na+-transporting ATPase subunit I [Eubacteriales bacterium SKADARSKE-1]|nr:V/A-type H+/Na+-transporting ATPase subunit I [Eubacteriales bacterium SKADARSKE-1]
MSIASMQKISIYALRKDRKPILETMQRLGVVEISDLDLNNESFEKIDTENSKQTFAKNAKVANDAIEIIDMYTQRKKESLLFLKGRKSISKDNYYTFVNETQEIMRVAYSVVNSSEDIFEEKSEITRLTLKKEALKSWVNLDISENFKGTKTTNAFIGTLPGEHTLDELLKKFSNLSDVENIIFEIISSASDQTCVFVLCKKEDSDVVEETLKNMGFAFLAQPTKSIPKDKIDRITEQVKEIEKKIKQKKELIKSYVGIKNALKFIVDYYSLRSQKYDIVSKLIHTKNVFMLTGYIKEKDSKKLESILTSKFDVAVELLEAKGDDVPISLENNGFVSPVEPVLESYSLPGKNEIDPSPIIAIFYYILFGIMLSDAAYGAITTIVCGLILLKFKNIESGFKKAVKMFLFCGISTTFWGIMFGSYFGDAIEVISETFFGTKIVIPALWFVPLNEPMRMLAFSFGIGIIHLFTGLFLKLYQLLKIKNYKDVVFDVISWYLLVGGAIIYLLSIPTMSELLTLNFKLSSSVGKIGAVCALIGAAIIIFTAGRGSKNPFKRLLKGLYSLYGITGYLSDIFSYSRLLALGLATGVIAQVFNKMGCMAGGGVLGAIVFTIVFLIGHTMNIGINLLGAYVHTNRLHFVEFFSKFYEGGGRKFSPFFVNTKYYKITEDVVDG